MFRLSIEDGDTGNDRRLRIGVDNDDVEIACLQFEVDLRRIAFAPASADIVKQGITGSCSFSISDGATTRRRVGGRVDSH